MLYTSPVLDFDLKSSLALTTGGDIILFRAAKYTRMCSIDDGDVVPSGGTPDT